jgi:hypothetical protein
MVPARPTVVLDLVGDDRQAADLAAGGVFVPGCTLALNDDCDLVLRSGDDELRVVARVVFVDDRGAGLQLARDADTKRRIGELATRRAPHDASAEQDGSAAHEANAEPDDSAPHEVSADPDGDAKLPASLHERMRGLTLVEQVRVAQRGEIHERIALERIYGKSVWEALLRNPRLTGPEVARIARMGSLPRVMIELVFANGAWLNVPEVRRALLSNPRLATDQILRVLRLLPKHELKLAPVQTAYPPAVRAAARRLLRGED